MKMDEKPAPGAQTTTKIIRSNAIKADVAISLVLRGVTVNGDNLDFLFLNGPAEKIKANLFDLHTKPYSDKRGVWSN